MIPPTAAAAFRPAANSAAAETGGVDLGVGGLLSSGWWFFLGGGAGVELAELVPLLGLPEGGSFLWPSPRSSPLLFSLGGVRRCPFMWLWPF